METRDFYFDLPEELIAQSPSERRGGSRLLVMNRAENAYTDSMVAELADFIDENTLLVFNNSKVRRARVYGNTLHGGQVEFLFLKDLGNNHWEVMCSKAKKQKIGKKYILPGELDAEITAEAGRLRTLKVSRELDDSYFNEFGHLPLPPYIKREDNQNDQNRYQTIYSDSEKVGSVAAPTAGLHFTEELFKKLASKNIDHCFVTLHVGIGTFLPVTAEKIEDHAMHSEEYEVPEETAQKIMAAKKAGKKILAVGTTSVRTLESAYMSLDEGFKKGRQSTNMFIYPGYTFKCVDHMFTNFHTPESTLLMMISAFAGVDFIREAYKHAVQEKYRFFSYGDGTLIL